jgi:D-sedoheptulose 7-phosphate isomerase
MSPDRDWESLVHKRIQENLAVKQALLRDREFIRLVVQVAAVITETLRQGHKVLLFGNGGSAADAQHIAAELVGRYRRERPVWPALALTVNTSSLTAVGNDYSFETVFSRQVEALGCRGDVANGISTSGNSVNVLRALHTARPKGLVTVGLTGRSGGKMKGASDYCICVSSDETARIQEGHILVGHIVCEIVEQALCDA